MILGLFTTVFILAGATPSVEVLPGDFLPAQECQARVDTLNKQPPSDVKMTADGKPILMTLYTCQLMDRSTLDSAMAGLKASG